MKKILLSLLTVSAVAAVAFVGTRAFFSDTETSANNTFTAGAIDLTVSSHSWSDNNNINVASGFATIPAKDWNEQSGAMFNFVDVKPGDNGGGRFDLNIVSNPAYACFSSQITGTADNDVIDPEKEAGDDPASTVGELQDYLNIVYFEDKNSNGTYEPGTDGALSAPVLLSTVSDTGWLALRDGSGGLFDGALAPNQIKNLGYLWCMGTFDPTTGACNGTGDQNKAQTDSVTGTLKFYATQVRNNETFTCASMNPVFVLNAEESGSNVTFNQENKDNNWPYVAWNINGDEIEFTFTNPTGITQSFYFDYQVDGASGHAVGGVTGFTPTSGRLNGVPWDNFHNFVVVGPGQTKTVTVSGTDEIKVRLRLGPERDYDFNWIVFQTQ